MNTIEEINLFLRAPLGYKARSTRTPVSKQFEKFNQETIINHFSIIIETINELEPIKQVFLTQDVLTSLREIQFLQDNPMGQQIQKNFNDKFEDALTSLAKIFCSIN